MRSLPSLQLVVLNGAHLWVLVDVVEPPVESESPVPGSTPLSGRGSEPLEGEPLPLSSSPIPSLPPQADAKLMIAIVMSAKEVVRVRCCMSGGPSWCFGRWCGAKRVLLFIDRCGNRFAAVEVVVGILHVFIHRSEGQRGNEVPTPDSLSTQG